MFVDYDCLREKETEIKTKAWKKKNVRREETSKKNRRSKIRYSGQLENCSELHNKIKRINIKSETNRKKSTKLNGRNIKIY